MPNPDSLGHTCDCCRDELTDITSPSGEAWLLREFATQDDTVHELWTVDETRPDRLGRCLTYVKGSTVIDSHAAHAMPEADYEFLVKLRKDWGAK